MTTKPISSAPAEAPSLSSLVIQAQALAATIEKLQADIQAALDQDREPSAAPAAEREYPHPNDRTDNRLRAYVASIRPLQDCDFRDDIQAANHRGRSLIERLALSAEGTDLPKLRLTAAQVADVLSFIHCSEPVDPGHWYQEPDDEPSHVIGLSLLLSALEKSLREPSAEEAHPAPAGADVSELPQALQAHLVDLQRRACELQNLLELLDRAEEPSPNVFPIAARLAGDLNEGLDSTALQGVLKGEGDTQ